ncbi:MSHA biogenesis protein MshK [Noviherbaspirillum agri]
MLTCTFSGISALATAQGLSDPTRPPAAAGMEQPSEGGAASAGPVLQSILISQRRAEAIVSGRVIHVGDKVGDARVVRITETEVLLREGKNLKSLKLFPNIEKQPDSSRIGSKANNR